MKISEIPLGDIISKYPNLKQTYPFKFHFPNYKRWKFLYFLFRIYGKETKSTLSKSTPLGDKKSSIANILILNKRMLPLFKFHLSNYERWKFMLTLSRIPLDDEKPHSLQISQP